MVYWGLIVGSGGIRSDESKRVGNYKITERGIAFAESRISVPAYVVVYNARAIGRSEETIYIGQALGEEFNYKAMMDSVMQRAGPGGVVAPPNIDDEGRPVQRPITELFQENS